MTSVTQADGVNHEQGQVIVRGDAAQAAGVESLRVQLTDKQIKTLAAGVLARWRASRATGWSPPVDEVAR